MIDRRIFVGYQIINFRVRCAWTKFKELSPILAAHGASYHINGMMYRACVQSVLTYGTETWVMKAENLHSLWSADCRVYDNEMARIE